MAFTKEAIFEAADKLKADGSQPTLAAVRNIIGGGSFTTISEALKEWKAAASPASQSLKEAAPDTITERLTAFGSEMWAAALAMANDRLANERAAMAVHRAELEAQRKEAADLADQVAAELDAERERAAGAAAQCAKESASMQAQLNEARQAEAKARADLNARDARIAEMSSRIDDAQATVQRDAATHATAMTKEQSGHQGTRDKLQAALSQFATASAELKAAAEKDQTGVAARAAKKAASTATIAAIRLELEDAKRKEETERAAASAARESLANLAGQLAALKPIVDAKPAQAVSLTS